MSKELTPAESAAALAALERLIADSGGSQSKASDRIGLSQQVISRAFVHGRIGRGLADAVAHALGTTLRELVGPYPNRFAAAELAREDGVPEEAIRSVLEERAELGADRSRLWWADRMRLRATQLGRK